MGWAKEIVGRGSNMPKFPDRKELRASEGVEKTNRVSCADGEIRVS